MTQIAKFLLNKFKYQIFKTFSVVLIAHLDTSFLQYYKKTTVFVIKMSSKVTVFLFLMAFVCDSFIAADDKFNVVPKLYEEIGCTETASAGNSNLKRYGK